MKTIYVQHRSIMKGERVFLEKSRKGTLRKVIAIMDNGEVKDHVGEVWKVKPSGRPDADYETVSSLY